MAAMSMSKNRFARSCEQASSYPQNELLTRTFEYALKAYRARLAKETDTVFHKDRRNVFIWDLVDDAKEFSLSPKLSLAEDLQRHVAEQPKDPRCRFVFLQTSTSRGPLCCSPEQLTYLLSYHQVMPSFLDFCFEFKHREDPISTTLYRQEDYIGKRHLSQELMHLGRSGTRIQHAFNILGFDESMASDGYTWPLRHITVYHSFDLKLGKAFWIIVKGNKVMRERITSSSSKPLQADLEATNTPTGDFVASLRTHLLILEWCSNLWSEYIDTLEYQSKKPSAMVTQSPVDELAKDIPAMLARERRSTMDNKVGNLRRDSNLSQLASRFSSVMPRFTRNWSSFSGRTSELDCSGGQNPITAHGHPPTPTKVRNVSLEDIFTFDELQNVHTLCSEVDKGCMVIEQNKRVLVQIRKKYKALADSSDLKSVLDIASCEADMMAFLQEVERLEGDLDNYQARLRGLLRKLETDEALFTGVLQYQSMQTGEYFSKSAQTSANKMEEWTIKMHDIAARTEQETVAMSIITFFTLVFLPGTFVAVRYGVPLAIAAAKPVLTQSQTFFSSGIVKFDGSRGDDLGDWNTQVPALKLFLIMSLPLMFITLAAWALLRSYAGRKHRVRSALSDIPAVEKRGDCIGGTVAVT